MTARYVATPQVLAEVAGALRREPRLGVDTEAASFHRYRDRIYLVQVSGRTETALIDPLAIADLGPLGALLADPQIEKVFHDADYDLRVLDRDYGFRAARLFDTRIAAQLAGEAAIGLAAVVEKYVGVKLDKEHQKADWSRRPLPPPMLAYAAADTQHLLALRDALEQRLEALGRLAWANEEFKQLESLRWTGAPAGGASDDESYLRLKGAKGLTPRSLAALRLLHRWRDSVAEREDKAPFRIIGNDALLGVSRALPASPAELGHVRELPPSLARRHGAALLDAVARAKQLPDAQLPRLERRPRPIKDPGFDGRLENLKAARNRIAVELGLDRGVLCGRSSLEAVARARPTNREALKQIPGLRRWQIDVLGDAFLEAGSER